jgi:transcription elongation factor Elf1
MGTARWKGRDVPDTGHRSIYHVYSTCLRCNHSLGTNTDVPHLRVGRKLAFDTTRGRLWVVCTRCGQWNLTPLEERWEALAECERLATNAEARSGGAEVALAQTTSGLELLRVGGMSNADIANWRYGRRIEARRRGLLWALMPLTSLAISLGVEAWRLTGAPIISVYSSALVGALLFELWRRPPRLWVRFADGDGGQRVLWFWELQHVRIERPAPDAAPVLVVPRMGGELRLQGTRAAAALASLLPKLNGADCTVVALSRVLARVADAERAAAHPPRQPGRGRRRRERASGHAPGAPVSRRPWEHLLYGLPLEWVVNTIPEHRLALEMAVTEEMERLELQARAEALTEEWREEEEIGAISDDLLLPESITERLRVMQERRETGGSGK